MTNHNDQGNGQTAGNPQLKTPDRADLEALLLSNGGASVAFPQHEPNAQRLLERGRPFLLPVKLRRKNGNPHARAAALWGRDIEGFQLIAGYKLGPSNEWLQHSWVVDGRRLYDTGTVAECYFGVALEPFEALAFWREHFLGGVYGGPLALLKRHGDAIHKRSSGSDEAPGLRERLEAKLIAIGGRRVVQQDDPHLPECWRRANCSRNRSRCGRGGGTAATATALRSGEGTSGATEWPAATR